MTIRHKRTTKAPAQPPSTDSFEETVRRVLSVPPTPTRKKRTARKAGSVKG